MPSIHGEGSGLDTSATWARQNPSDALSIFQKGLTIDLIATPRSQFETCGADEVLEAVVKRNRANHFDFLPVTEKKRTSPNDEGRIIGLIELVPFMTGNPADGFVAAHMRPLSEENLVGADAGILDFVRDADRQQCRLIVTGSTISGLVSLSDLQRLPVRAALFGIVTHLEITIANAVRKEFGTGDEWLDRLPPGRQAKIAAEIANARSQDAYVDALLFTQFCDKVTIIKKRPDFPWIKNTFEHELKRIQALRDSLAHANNYAATRDDACRLCETVRLVGLWIERLRELPAKLLREIKAGWPR